MGLIIEGIILGVLTGGIYALMSSGLTLVFGVMDIINVGQGALVILGAYLSYVLERNLHIDLFVGLLITMPAMFLLGILISFIFRPIKRDRTMLSVLVTFGIALMNHKRAHRPQSACSLAQWRTSAKCTAFSDAVNRWPALEYSTTIT